MPSLAGRIAVATWTSLAKRAGRGYVAGPELEDAVATCAHLGSLGLSTTVAYWNRIGDDAPDRIVDANLQALRAFSHPSHDWYLSVKLPPLRFDPERVEQILAASGDALVHFDAHGPDTAAATFESIARAHRTHPRLGYTLPGRWDRSVTDANLALDLGLHVRVVKGQWASGDHPDPDLREGFLRVVDRLVGARSVSIATHDAPLAREALRRLLATGTPCGLELLYGLPVRPALRVAKELGVPVRVYVPFGQGWAPYTLAQARKSPRVIGWLVRDVLSGGSPFRGDELPEALRPITDRPRATRSGRGS